MIRNFEHAVGNLGEKDPKKVKAYLDEQQKEKDRIAALPVYSYAESLLILASLYNR